MTLTLQQIEELHRLSPEQKYDMSDYFNTKNYKLSKRRKAIMNAIQEYEQESEFEREQDADRR